MEFRVITKAMKLYPYQSLFFSTHEYDAPQPVFPEVATHETLESLEGKNILLLTGIASPEQMEQDLTPISSNITTLTYGDHHAFRSKDIRRINETFHDLPAPKLIITTEKDATRLEAVEGQSDEVKSHLFTLPIHMAIMLDQQEDFNKLITKYVRKNSRNGSLVKGKDDNKSKDSYRSGDRPRTISF